MIGYTFAILGVLIFFALFFAARAFGSGRRRSQTRPDYEKGSTYEKPQAEGVPADADHGPPPPR